MISEEEENYLIVFELLTDWLENVSTRGDIPADDIIAPMADILATIAAKSAGVEGVKSVIHILLDRLEGVALGDFPPTGA